MTERHKLGRQLAKRAAINGKCTTYLDNKYNYKLSHNYKGAKIIEKFVFDNGKVKVYVKEGAEFKEIREQAKPAKKAKSSPKLSDTPDEKSGGDIQQ